MVEWIKYRYSSLRIAFYFFFSLLFLFLPLFDFSSRFTISLHLFDTCGGTKGCVMIRRKCFILLQTKRNKRDAKFLHDKFTGNKYLRVFLFISFIYFYFSFLFTSEQMFFDVAPRRNHKYVTCFFSLEFLRFLYLLYHPYSLYLSLSLSIE